MSFAKANNSETIDTSEEDIYINKSNAYSVLSFVTAHILSDKPDDPLMFMHELFFKCLEYRKGNGNPPFLLSKNNIKILCKAITGSQEGLTADQFCTAMNILLINDFKMPVTHGEQELIDPSYFVDEVMRIQTNQIHELCLLKK